MFHRAFIVVVVTVVLTACATSPLGHQQLQIFSDEQMNEQATADYKQMKQETPEVTDPRVNQYVGCVANAITDELNVDTTWEVTVFDTPDVINAFAMPGGKIGVYTGLFKAAQTPDQLAAVLGHEVAHVLAKHGNAQQSASLATQTGLALAQIVTEALTDDDSRATTDTVFSLAGLGAQYGILLPYGRAQETEADLLGLDLMASAGFDPRQSVTLWHNMSLVGGQKPPEFLSTHPSDETRIEDLNARMARALRIYQHARSQGKAPDCG